MDKHIRSLLDLQREDFESLFQRALALKANRLKGEADKTLVGKNLGLIFDKASTRTRVSFEAAMIQLGGTPIFISTRDSQIARAEPPRDTARVLSRYLDGLAIRTYSQDLLEEFAAFASVPVINALTDLFHPCQVLSDLMTIIELKGDYRNLKIVWVGDGNNVAHSWINAAAVLDLDLTLACPAGFFPDDTILAKAQQQCKGRIVLTSDPLTAVQNADVIYTDVWASMGQEAESNRRKEIFADFQVNQSLVERASAKVIVMHCLPAHRDEEISTAVLEGAHSVVWDQAENKLHMHKAILERLMME